MKAIILAAGEGKRMNSNTPKVLHKILGKTLLQYVIDATKDASINQLCVVLGHKKEEIQNTLNHDTSIEVAVQNDQLGTGHAVMTATDFIGNTGNVCVLFGDTPLIRSEHLQNLVKIHEHENNDITLISAVVQDPTGYGRVVTNQSGFIKIVEHKDASEEQKKICDINTGIMCFKAETLQKALKQLSSDNAQNEYYLTDTLEIIQNLGGKAQAITVYDEEDFFGINTKVQLHDATRIMQKRINNEHMLNGVTIIDSDTTYIEPTVTIGKDTEIYPNTMISGNTNIGENCTIEMGCNLSNMVLHDNVKISSSTAVDSVIKKGASVGPFAYIRPNSEIGENAKIGDFVEIKNAKIGANSKASHLTYIGDAEVGSGVNFGCGTVTVNYDGKKKFKTIVKDNAFVGCNTNLVAPVVVEEGSYIAAGSTITKDVPDNSLAIARARQENKTNWTPKHK